MADFPQPGSTLGRYTIVEPLGHGGSSTVYRATRGLSRQEYALKVIGSELAARPGFREQFLAEADTLTRLRSPHIVGIHDAGESDGTLYLATDLVPGGDLGTRLLQGAVPLRTALTLAAQVATALAAAHDAGIVHGDVKPGNVLLGQRDGLPHAYLADFGVAQPAGAGGTRRSVVVGTYAYLAPELITGGAVSPASDVYALGCLLVAAVTGTPPYGGTDQEIAQQHLTSEIPLWEATSPLLEHLNELVRTSMAKDPAARYPSARAFGSAITAVLGEVPSVEPVPAAPEPAPEPAAESAAEPAVEPVLVDEPERPRRGGRALASSLVALVAVAAAVAGIAILQSGDDDGSTPAAAAPTTSSPTPSTTSSPTPAPTSSPTPGQTKVCQEGREIKADQRCGEPYGFAGLRYVFSNISGDCTQKSSTNATNYWVISCTVGSPDGAAPAEVTYTIYRTTSLGRETVQGMFPGQAPTTVSNGLLQFGPVQEPSGRSTIGLTYPEKHPYGVLITASSTSEAQQLAAATAAAALPPERFVVE
ncbi:MAG: serine/threonine-protein kinase [Propionibacteriales bacterium]|nr:serine/threonine-protein kinase [Propionibacteriales bacterium]